LKSSVSCARKRARNLIIRKRDAVGSSPLWLTEADVTASIDLAGAIDAIERVLAAEASGQAANMTKTLTMVGVNDALQAIGGSIAAEGFCGTKTWVNVGGKSQTVLILFSLTDGSLQAVIEATALGQIRTAAMSGVGTKWLARPDADEMAIVGTGKQALPQIAAVLAVRPLKRVRVFSRTEASRIAVADATRLMFPHIDVVAAGSLEAACDSAPIVTLCTNATQPFFTSGMAASGAHINAIGAIVPARAEFADDIFPRCDEIAVDTLDGAKELSREFIDYFGPVRASWDRVTPLSALIRRGYHRPAGADLTLFKPLGIGIADLAVAVEVVRRCRSRDKGHALPERVRSELPLRVDANRAKEK
jgi:ornithine cyclodeaminase